MSLQLINIGFGNIVSANRVIAIVSPEAAPVKRMVQDARERGLLIDATCGRRTRAVLVTDRNRLPVVLRGLRRTLGGSSKPPSENVPVSRSRRLLALVLVLAAFVLAVV